MKKIIKNLGTIILCIFVSFSQVSNMVYALEKEDTKSEISSGSLNKNVTWNLSSDGILTISGKGEMPNYSSTGAIPWYEYRQSIKKIEIKDGITNIGSWSFYGSDVTEVDIAESVTRIGDLAFVYCYKLGKVIIPKNVNSIAARTFEDCTSITEINVEEGNKSYCSINGVLFSADKKKLIHYPKNYQKTSYVIPDGVTSIGQGAFQRCSTLEHLEIPSTVTSFEYSALSDCGKLASAGPIGSGCNIEYAWEKNIPAKAFYNTLLTSVTIGKDIKSIDSEAFNWCSKLTDVYYKGNESEWKQISISNGNEKLSNATIHYEDGTDITPEPPEEMPEPKPLDTPKTVEKQGDGTENSPYRITTANEFAKISEHPKAHYILASDINVSQKYNGEFEGVFDGNHHTITLNKNAATGLFETNVGKIKNLNIKIGEELQITEKGITIGSISSDNKGIIQDCTVKGYLHIIYKYVGGNLYAGGIAGTNTGEIKRCWNAATFLIEGVQYDDGTGGGARTHQLIAGGIAGKSYGNIEQCLNSGKIWTNYSENIAILGNYVWYMVGGIAGCIDTNCSKVVSCVQAGDEIEMNGTFIGHSSGANHYLYAGVYYDVQTGFIVGGEYNHGTKAAILTTKVTKDCSVYEKGELEVNLHDVDAYCTIEKYYNADKTSYNKLNYKKVKEWWDHLERENTIKTSILFEESQVNVNLGETENVTATYISDKKPLNIEWGCSNSEAVSFSKTTTTGPENTEKENTWKISTQITGKKTGEYDLILKIDDNVEKIKIYVQHKAAVQYFSKWDDEKQIAYFGQNDLTGSRITDETDHTFLPNIGDLLGHYVLVYRRDKSDNNIDADELIKIEKIESIYGKVEEINDSTIRINNDLYNISAECDIPEYTELKNSECIIHLHDNKVIGIEKLQVKSGTVVEWNKTTGELEVAVNRDKKIYRLSYFSDEKNLTIPDKGKDIRILCDNENLFYEAYGYHAELPEFNVKKDAYNFTNSDVDFFNNKELEKYRYEKANWYGKVSSFVGRLMYSNENVNNQISEESFEKCVSGLDNDTRQLIENKKNSIWGGSCEGMVKSAAIHFADPKRLPLYKISTQNINSIYGLHKPKDAEKYDELTEDMINYYQLIQFRPEEDKMLNPKNSNYKIALSEMIQRLNARKAPILFTISDKMVESRHMVLPIKVEEDTDDYYKIKIWDPNVKDEYTYMKVYKTEDSKRTDIPVEEVAGNIGTYFQIEYISGNTASENSREYAIMFYKYPQNTESIDELDYHNYFTKIDSNTKKTGYDYPVITTDSDDDLSVKTANAKLIYRDGKMLTYENAYRMYLNGMITGEDDVKTAKEMFGMNAYSEDGIYKLQLTSKNGAGRAGILINGWSIDICSEKDLNITLDEKARTATIKAAEPGKISILTTKNEVTDKYPWYNTAIDMKDSTELTVTLKEDSTELSGDGLTNAVVAVRGTNEIEKVNISTEENKVVLTKNGEGYVNAGEAGYIKGDVNRDQIVDIQDLRIVLKYVCGKELLEDKKITVADVTEDNVLDIRDLRKILRFVCGKEAEL